MRTNPSKRSPEFLKRELYLIFLFGTTLSPSLFASLWWHRSKGHRNDELHCREIHFLPIWANTVNNPHWVGAAKRQQQKSKLWWKKTLLSHSRMLHDPKTVNRSDFDQETAEKIAPQFIARLDLANCTTVQNWYGMAFLRNPWQHLCKSKVTLGEACNHRHSVPLEMLFSDVKVIRTDIHQNVRIVSLIRGFCGDIVMG